MFSEELVAIARNTGLEKPKLNHYYLNKHPEKVEFLTEKTIISVSVF